MYDDGYGQPGWDGGYRRGPRRSGGCLSHAGVAVLSAAVAAGLILALHQRPASNGGSPAPPPAGSAIPAPASSAPPPRGASRPP